MLTWARTQKRRARSSAEAELCGIGSGAIESFGAAQLLLEWQYKAVQLPQTHRAHLRCASEEGVVEWKHFELKMLTVHEWLKTGRRRIHKASTHDIPVDHTHDPGHDPTETDQVWTCPELARVILHILGPTCTVTSVTPITATLTVLMNTVNNFQNHRLTVYLGTMIETRSTVREKNSSQPSTQNSVVSAKCQCERSQHDDCYGQCEQCFHEGSHRE